MKSRINKLANITGNGPQCPSENANDVKKLEKRFFFSFLESNKKKVMRGF